MTGVDGRGDLPDEIGGFLLGAPALLYAAAGLPTVLCAAAVPCVPAVIVVSRSVTPRSVTPRSVAAGTSTGIQPFARPARSGR
ncbi:hypothetical protein [Planomonospora sp. ID82291]|uniref:hypothetical protein n=1 Tax=Planomonospora sp. ID82291 TaxID=2738136 RepID=UPI0018C398CB|nr:hypothetical protein [Planomonospora sp. ID82291]MBG0815723.1 hypothetical protein [Planomonospora sp. ID82291]